MMMTMTTMTTMMTMMMMMMMMMMHGPCAVPVWDSYVEGFPSVKCCLLQAMKARSRFGAWVCAGLLGCLTASGSNLCPTV